MEIVERESVLEEMIDEIVPEGLDWERLVVTYPLPALALAALGGFLLGRRHGTQILAAASSYAVAEFSDHISHSLGRESR